MTFRDFLHRFCPLFPLGLRPLGQRTIFKMYHLVDSLCRKLTLVFITGPHTLVDVVYIRRLIVLEAPLRSSFLLSFERPGLPPQ